jgi:hypothetical protein
MIDRTNTSRMSEGPTRRVAPPHALRLRTTRRQTSGRSSPPASAPGLVSAWIGARAHVARQVLRDLLDQDAALSKRLGDSYTIPLIEDRLAFLLIAATAAEHRVSPGELAMLCDDLLADAESALQTLFALSARTAPRSFRTNAAGVMDDPQRIRFFTGSLS